VDECKPLGVGWRKDAPDAAAPDNGRLDYCEVVMWPDTADRIWLGSTDHARHVIQCVMFHPVMCQVRYVVNHVAVTGMPCDTCFAGPRGDHKCGQRSGREATNLSALLGESSKSYWPLSVVCPCEISIRPSHPDSICAISCKEKKCVPVHVLPPKSLTALMVTLGPAKCLPCCRSALI